MNLEATYGWLGTRFDPVYCVHERGHTAWFVGCARVAAGGRPRIADQTDLRICGPFRAMALWPDGTLQSVLVERTGTEFVDTAVDGVVESPVYGVLGYPVEHLRYDLASFECAGNGWMEDGWGMVERPPKAEAQGFLDQLEAL